MLWLFALVNAFPMCGLTIPQHCLHQKGEQLGKVQEKGASGLTAFFLHSHMWLGERKGKAEMGWGKTEKPWLSG